LAARRAVSKKNADGKEQAPVAKEKAEEAKPAAAATTSK
jgi:hypothetical protein